MTETQLMFYREVMYDVLSSYIRDPDTREEIAETLIDCLREVEANPKQADCMLPEPARAGDAREVV